MKVLQCRDFGTTGTVIDGVEWVVTHAADSDISKKLIANMTLGEGFSQSSNTAMSNVHNSGILTAVEAGNNNGDACSVSPASEPTVVTVGSLTCIDRHLSFSDHESCLGIFLPGTSTTSAWIGINLASATISGTSMTSPHVAGGFAVTLATWSTDADSVVLNTVIPDKLIDPRQNYPNDELLSVGRTIPIPPC